MNIHAAKFSAANGEHAPNETVLEPIELSLETLALVAGGEGTVTLYKKPHLVSHQLTTL
jgi:hypothetical protein